MTDPGGAVLQGAGSWWFPAAGLSIGPTMVAGVHARRIGTLSEHSGVLEIDLKGGRHPIGFAMPPGIDAAATFREFVADFCQSATETEALTAWRAGLQAPFVPCECCKSAMEIRRAHAGAHPLAPMFADAADAGLELHCRVAGCGFSFERFLSPAKLDADGALTVHDRFATSLLRIDPALIHAVRITVETSEGEQRTVVRVHDLLGEVALTFSAAGGGHAARWRHFLALAGG